MKMLSPSSMARKVPASAPEEDMVPSFVDTLILDHSKWIVIGVTAFFILWKRSGESASVVCGALVSAAVARLLKVIIAQPRPQEASWKSSEGFCFVLILIISVCGR